MAEFGDVPVKLNDKPGTRYYECAVCGLSFPEHETVLWRGKRYGRPCGDARDLRDVIRRQDGSYRNERIGVDRGHRE